MPPIDPRDPPRRLLAATAHDFARTCADQAEAGASLAAGELTRLAALAARLASDVSFWAQALNELDLARQTRLVPARAGRLLIESVFDEALTPAGCRVLSAALDVAWLERAEGIGTAIAAEAGAASAAVEQADAGRR